MGEHGHEQPLDVVGRRIRATLDERDGAREAIERKTAPDRGPHLELLELPRRSDELHDPAAEERVDVDVLDGGEQLGELVPCTWPSTTRISSSRPG